MTCALQQFAASSIRFPFTMLALGARLSTRMLTSIGPELGGMNASLYVANQAAQRELDPLWLSAYQIGDAMQRELFDNAMRFAVWNFRDLAASGMRDVAESLLLLPRRSIRVAAAELRSKLHVYKLVRSSNVFRDEQGRTLPLATAVKRAYARPMYERIWSVEGLGHDYAAAIYEDQREPVGMLAGGEAAGIADQALTMLHAGMGLAFAESLWDGISPFDCKDRIADALQRFDDLCRANSRPGYCGAAREALGLVTRTLDPLLTQRVDEAIRARTPELCGYFWHGAGRALYFTPTHFIPGVNSPWKRILTTAPHPLGVNNLIAGLAWATALVNLRNPEIVSDLVANLEPQIRDTGAFAHGVSSALMMAHDLDPGNAWIQSFLTYLPSDRAAAEAWRTVVREPGRYALQYLYPGMRSRGRFELLPFSNGEPLTAGPPNEAQTLSDSRTPRKSPATNAKSLSQHGLLGDSLTGECC